MKSFHFILIVIAILPLKGHCQVDTQYYKKMFDHVNLQANLNVDDNYSSTLPLILKSLDSGFCQDFFIAVGRLLNSEKYLDASVVFYVGIARCEYFVNAKNDSTETMKEIEYQIYLGSRRVYEYQILAYLMCDIEKFMKVIEYSKRWIIENDFTNFTKMNNLAKYEKSKFELETRLIDFEQNKQKYKQDWAIKLDKFKKELGLVN